MAVGFVVLAGVRQGGLAASIAGTVIFSLRLAILGSVSVAIYRHAFGGQASGGQASGGQAFGLSAEATLADAIGRASPAVVQRTEAVAGSALSVTSNHQQGRRISRGETTRTGRP
jgi:hypothetical protein